MKYKIFYDYTDDEGDESRNNVEFYDGDYNGLQRTLKSMRDQGCYNIQATALNQD